MTEQEIVGGFPKLWAALFQERMAISSLDRQTASVFSSTTSPNISDDQYDYDTKINMYNNVAALEIVDYCVHCFHQTLVCVDKTHSNYVTTAQKVYFSETFKDIRKFIVEGTSF